MIRRIHALREMTVGELRLEWARLYGEPTRSRNRDYLWRRLAWRVQEVQHGGLSDRAKVKLAELGAAGFTRARTPQSLSDAALVVPPPEVSTPKTKHDPRLPSPGTVISRSYHGRELRLLVLADGYELDGVRYGSLSEAARAATGAHWNGRLFFGLTQRSRRA